jgi:hypothetical protein
VGGIPVLGHLGKGRGYGLLNHGGSAPWVPRVPERARLEDLERNEGSPG